MFIQRGGGAEGPETRRWLSSAMLGHLLRHWATLSDAIGRKVPAQRFELADQRNPEAPERHSMQTSADEVFEVGRKPGFSVARRVRAAQCLGRTLIFNESLFSMDRRALVRRHVLQNLICALNASHLCEAHRGLVASAIGSCLGNTGLPERVGP